MFLELTTIFFDEFKTYTEKIQDAILNNNPKQLTEFAHSAKGALANLSAVSASSIAKNLEFMGKSGDFSCAQEQFDAFLKAVELFRLEIDRLKESNSWETNHA